MADPIRVRIPAQEPRLFIVDKLDAAKPGCSDPCELLTLSEQEAKDLRAALDNALTEGRGNRCLYIVGHDGIVTIDRGNGGLTHRAGGRCRHDLAIRIDTSGANVLCNCCGNSLRVVDLQPVGGNVPSLAGRCRSCYEPAPILGRECMGLVCEAAKVDGVVCADDVCDYATGVRARPT